ncbi:MAG: transglycosylase SLT domain-containing protein [Desulforhopalus sp.]
MLRKRNLFLLLIIIGLWHPLLAHSAFTASQTQEGLLERNTVFNGDFDEMAKRKIIRVLMPYNRAFFFFNGAEPKGISYETAMLFEKFINKKLKTGTVKIQVLVIPTPREQLFSRLIEGGGDIAMGNLTITDKRRKIVDFSDPFAKDINEILVTDKDYPDVPSVFNLSGMKIHVRKSSSYYESLKNLNDVLRHSDKKPVQLIEVDDQLEDSDLLEMINAGLIPAIIIDEHKGDLWLKIFDNIKLHRKAKVNSGGKIGWALRKNSPKLKALINEFATNHKVGSLMGNVVVNRYLKSAKHITNSTQARELKKFEKMVTYFKAYGDKYDFDYLMLAALAYQESRHDQSLRSHVGAVGVMQILPTTASDKNVNISGIEKLDPNIHAGTKYLRFLSDRYFPEDGELDELNRVFFTFASYNAGPARIAKLRREAKKMSLDPNVWFNNVEVVAAKRIGRETVQYVRNILKYYVAYKLLADKIPQPSVK